MAEPRFPIISSHIRAKGPAYRRLFDYFLVVAHQRSKLSRVWKKIQAIEKVANGVAAQNEENEDNGIKSGEDREGNDDADEDGDKCHIDSKAKYRDLAHKLEVLSTAVKPKIISRCPIWEHHDYPLAKGVASFAFPYGTRIKDLRSGETSPRCFSFVLTSPEGSKQYGATLIFDEHISIEQDEDTVATTTAEEKSSTPPPFQAVASKALVILSHHPYFNQMEELLKMVFRISICKKHPYDIERIIWLIVRDMPLPVEPNNRLDFEMYEKRISFQGPGYVEKLPLLHCKFGMLFELVSHDHIVAAVMLLLQEHKLVLVSDYSSVLVHCAESLRALLYPLEWQSVYIPLLPSAAKNVLLAPVPFFVGLKPASLADLVDEEPLNSDIAILNIDKGVLELPSPAPKSLPSKIKNRLMNALLIHDPSSSIHRTNKLSAENMKKRDLAFPMGTEAIRLDQQVEEIKQEHHVETTRLLKIRSTFFEVLLSGILTGYKRYIITPKDAAPAVAASADQALFKDTDFVRSRPSFLRELTTIIVQTMAFGEFVQLAFAEPNHDRVACLALENKRTNSRMMLNSWGKLFNSGASADNNRFQNLLDQKEAPLYEDDWFKIKVPRIGYFKEEEEEEEEEENTTSTTIARVSGEATGSILTTPSGDSSAAAAEARIMAVDYSLRQPSEISFPSLQRDKFFGEWKTFSFEKSKPMGFAFFGNQVQKVIPGSPADIAGIRVGWMLVSIDNRQAPLEQIDLVNLIHHRKQKHKGTPLKVAFRTDTVVGKALTREYGEASVLSTCDEEGIICVRLKSVPNCLAYIHHTNITEIDYGASKMEDEFALGYDDVDDEIIGSEDDDDENGGSFSNSPYRSNYLLNHSTSRHRVVASSRSRLQPPRFVHSTKDRKQNKMMNPLQRRFSQLQPGAKLSSVIITNESVRRRDSNRGTPRQQQQQQQRGGEGGGGRRLRARSSVITIEEREEGEGRLPSSANNFSSSTTTTTSTTPSNPLSTTPPKEGGGGGGEGVLSTTPPKEGGGLSSSNDDMNMRMIPRFSNLSKSISGDKLTRVVKIAFGPGKVGISFDGKKVVKVDQGSQAMFKGVETDMIVVQINGHRASNHSEANMKMIRDVQNDKNSELVMVFSKHRSRRNTSSKRRLLKKGKSVDAYTMMTRGFSARRQSSDAIQYHKHNPFLPYIKEAACHTLSSDNLLLFEGKQQHSSSLAALISPLTGLGNTTTVTRSRGATVGGYKFMNAEQHQKQNNHHITTMMTPSSDHIDDDDDDDDDDDEVTSNGGGGGEASPPPQHQLEDYHHHLHYYHPPQVAEGGGGGGGGDVESMNDFPSNNSSLYHHTNNSNSNSNQQSGRRVAVDSKYGVSHDESYIVLFPEGIKMTKDVDEASVYLTTIPQGTRLLSEGRVGRRVFVKYEGRKGWVSKYRSDALPLMIAYKNTPDKTNRKYGNNKRLAAGSTGSSLVSSSSSSSSSSSHHHSASGATSRSTSRRPSIASNTTTMMTTTPPATTRRPSKWLKWLRKKITKSSDTDLLRIGDRVRVLRKTSKLQCGQVGTIAHNDRDTNGNWFVDFISLADEVERWSLPTGLIEKVQEPVDQVLIVQFSPERKVGMAFNEDGFVTQVLAKSQAFAKGVEIGSQILRVNGMKAKSGKAFEIFKPHFKDTAGSCPIVVEFSLL